MALGRVGHYRGGMTGYVLVVAVLAAIGGLLFGCGGAGVRIRCARLAPWSAPCTLHLMAPAQAWYPRMRRRRSCFLCVVIAAAAGMMWASWVSGERRLGPRALFCGTLFDSLPCFSRASCPTSNSVR